MTDPRDIRKRLEQLNRAPLPGDGSAAPDIEAIRRTLADLRARRAKPVEPIHYRRDVPRHAARPPKRRELIGPPIALEEAVPGAAFPSPLGPKAYLVETRATELEDCPPRLVSALRDRLAEADSPVRQRLRRNLGMKDVAPEEIVFCDLETTGFMGAPLFLVGAMFLEEGGLVIRQYLARDYSEEGAAIALFHEDAARRRLLVTFNGKSFDWPTLRVRAAATGAPFGLDPAHLDLLHVCRRVWRGSLPNCQLQTLESRVCGRSRSGDIPGAEIPDAYHHFVRTANAAEMVNILHHNRLDLLTLAELMVRLPPLKESGRGVREGAG